VESVPVEIVRLEIGPSRLAAVPLPLVGHPIAGCGHHPRDVRQTGRELDLRVRRRLHVLLERVLDPMLGRDVAGHQRRARRGAHAGVRESVGELQPVSAKEGQPGQVPFGPARREMLDGAVLIGDEHDHVLAPEVGARRLGGLRERAARQQHGGRHRRGLQQLTPRHTLGPWALAHPCPLNCGARRATVSSAARHPLTGARGVNKGDVAQPSAVRHVWQCPELRGGASR
jgi:hypothetical protein